ncbi:MAG: alpha/beta hydrolase [Chloroflexi bacterium]|nr:alpha/beta hydrolase [Chloroflexota bacterium]
MATQFLKHQNGILAYDDAGSGPLVICVPSMGDLRGEYRFLAPQLVAAGYRAISLDVRGHGESSTEWPDFSVAAIGSDILALIRHLNAGPAFIVGASMAAGAGVWAAAEAPDLIRGLVLIGPFVRGAGDKFLQLMLAVMFARPWGPSMWLKYFATLYPTHKPADFAEYTIALRANLKARGRLEALHHMLRASKLASEQRLPRVTAPVKVLMGSKDRDFKDPEAEAKLVANSLRSTYQMIENAGHYPHAEMPEITGPIILSALKAFHENKN